MTGASLPVSCLNRSSRPGIGKAARVEDEAAAVAGFVDGHLVMEGEAEDANGEFVGAGGDVLQLL